MVELPFPSVPSGHDQGPSGKATRPTRPVQIWVRFGAALLGPALLLCGCLGGKAHSSYPLSTGGSAKLGRLWIAKYKCGKCHSIPGVREADGVFGPPLIAMGSRTMIAGNFPNTPENMVHWIEAPTSMKPNTDMPDLGLSEQQARDVAQFIENLH